MGVQSMNPSLRKAMGRPMPEKIIERAIRCIRAEGIGLFCDQIYGLPGETEDDYKAMVSFYRRVPTDFVNVYWVNYFPGTDMIQQGVDAGVLTEDQAKALQANPVAGDVSTISEYHHSRGKKYKVYMEGYNYLPQWLCDFLMKSGLWWVVGKLNVFRFFRFFFGLGLKSDAEHFPTPRKGYDISSFRFPAMTKRFMRLRVSSWLGFDIPFYRDAGRAGAPPPTTPLEKGYVPPPPRGREGAASKDAATQAA